jgi:hypothetical protein
LLVTAGGAKLQTATWMSGKLDYPVRLQRSQLEYLAALRAMCSQIGIEVKTGE